jgi:hypothetical protein
MASVSADRRLVKSPPELWAEVSDPETLARHLGEFGEIRITRKQPEKIVAWEGERASGTVEIEASGWGTRVILTAEARPAAGPPSPAPRSAAEPGARMATREPLLPRFAAPQPAALPPTPIVQTPPDRPAAPLRPSEPSPWERRRSLLSRVFPRRLAPLAEMPPEPPLVPVPEPEPSPEPPAPDPPSPEPEPLHPPQPEVPPEPAATRPRLEPESQPAPPPPDTLRVLEAVLDDLGAAHHRPFSRG